MQRRKPVLWALFATLAGFAQPAQSRVMLDMEPFDHQMGGFVQAGPFTMLDPPVGHAGAPQSAGGTHGSTIARVAGGVLVIDEDSGELVRLDAERKVIARRAIGTGASQLAVDQARSRAFVVDRAADRVVIVDLAGNGLRVLGDIRTAREPFGVAVTPDGKTLLVTTVADRALTAYDAHTSSELWQAELAPEPRGVAISADGKQALVGFLSGSALARLDLSRSRPVARYLALDPPATASAQPFFEPQVQQAAANAVPGSAAPTRPDPVEVGRQFARNAFAVGWIGHGLAVVPHQVSTPLAPTNGSENMGSYGGGFTPPIAHRLTFLDAEGSGRIATAEIDLHQPRALAYSADTDTLYVAGYGSDTISAFAEVSQPSVHLAWQRSVADQGPCGPNGLAVGDDGSGVDVFCSMSRRVVGLAAHDTTARWSEPLTESRLDAEQQAGRELFRRGRDPRLSQGGALACASCHPEGRTDGLSWRIEGHTLQTPLLTGRLEGSHPFKWDGKDSDLRTSLRNTVQRLGGSGLQAQEAEQLRAFLVALPAARTPTPRDTQAVARGRALFYADQTGCADCHAGALYSDGNQHDLAPELGTVDTPSLRGLALSAPYYHDGSARTLRALLMDNGSVHGMGATAQLDDREIADLVAFLETL
jgi:DNA-binding beta-propeller fold protein YncE